MYNELLSEKVIEKDNRLKNPRVFISYTRTDKENERWVRIFVDMLSRQEQNKYIAILRDSNIDKSLSVYIKSRYALDWSADEVSDEEFNELLLQLFNCDAEPPIGEIPDFIKEKLAR